MRDITMRYQGNGDAFVSYATEAGKSWFRLICGAAAVSATTEKPQEFKAAAEAEGLSVEEEVRWA